MILEPVTYKKTGASDYRDYPLGSIILSASEDAGPEWLRCNGSYINQTDYPALVEYLGKTIPGTQEATKLGGEGYNGLFSTSYNADGYVWVYWFDEAKLLGFPIEEGDIKEIPVTGQFDFVESVDAPVILSICGGRVFLCQTAVDLSYIYVYSGVFSEDAVSMSKIDTASAVAAESGKRSYKLYVPEVVFVKDYVIGNVTKDRFVIMAYSSASSATLYYFALVISADDMTEVTAQRLFYTGNNYGITAESPYVSSLFRFSRKNANECVILEGYNSTSSNSNSITAIRSFMAGVYKSGNTVSVKTYYTNYADPVLVSPIASKEAYIYRAYILDHEMYLRAGSVTPFTAFENNDYTKNAQKLAGITLSPYAQLFPDSLEYLSSHNMFVIFVGTGICFSHTPLDMGSWGYFDTTEYFGVISQLGNAEFDVETNTLCLSGRDTEGNFVCGRLRLHERYDYSNDGAWLPYIASSGVPAWIKSTEADGGDRKIKISVKAGSGFDYDYYYAVILNGDRLVCGKTYTRTVPTDTETFTVGLEVLEQTNATSGILYIDGSQLLQISPNSAVGATKTAELRWEDYSGTMELKIGN